MTQPNNPLSDPEPTITTIRSDASELPQRTVPAWLLSFLLHTLVLVFLILILSRFSGGASKIENRAGGIVLVNAVATTTEYLSEGDVSEPSPAATLQQSPPPMPSEKSPPHLPGLESSNSELTGVGQDFAESLSGAESLLDGTGSQRPIGGAVTTEVFGVKGTGSQFVYVFDRSASMDGYGGRPLRAAKQALLESLESLEKNHQFQIVFYNDQTKIFRPEPGAARLAFATDTMKQKGVGFVQSIRGDRGTNHMNALKEALSFKPDVVFLLTDAEGGFSASDLNRISRWNSSGAVINAIEFGVGTSSALDNSLRILSRENGGQYTYKNILSFRD
ncbi:MAG: hypothetical protein MK106_01235 [Mariniblastus sp.]|nr:hypothetical protein [Mariniblastus sp.]